MNNFLMVAAILFFGAIIFSPTGSEPTEDKQALLDFLNNVRHSRSLNWNISGSVCTSWVGVTCNRDQSGVVALRLPSVSLLGPIPPNTLSRLSQLQILSLRSNGLRGSFPADFSKLKNLKALYFHFNRLSGPLPSEFSSWKNLSIIDLSNNGFNGSIPLSISHLTNLISLNLANNSLSGEIPDFNLPGLQHLNLSNNNLTGTVPKSLQRFPISAFSGNNLSSENALPPAQPLQPPHRKKPIKLDLPAILGIAISGCVLLFVIIALLMIICYAKNQRKAEESQSKLPTKKETPTKKKEDLDNDNDEKNKLVFFEGHNLAFNLEDLLRASADLLGKGVFGTTYKAVLEDASIVVVKRLKEVSVSKQDFEQQMEIVGSIKHVNVVPLRAYFCSKEEKLMVYDHYQQGSLSALLHGNRGEDRIPLDWDTRLKIALGAARGIAHIHEQKGGKLVHGNLKSTNIFLNSIGYGCVSEVGLATLTNPVGPPATRTLQWYCAPEVIETRKSTQASDVYSFGVLLLEILTGKSPVSNTEEVVNLVRWVNSVVKEEWTAEVFDLELLRYQNIEAEMVALLQIGLSCAVRVPDKRPKIAEVVKMVEDIRMSQSVEEIRSGASSANSVPTPLSSAAGPSHVQK